MPSIVEGHRHPQSRSKRLSLPTLETSWARPRANSLRKALESFSINRNSSSSSMSKRFHNAFPSLSFVSSSTDKPREKPRPLSMSWGNRSKEKKNDDSSRQPSPELSPKTQFPEPPIQEDEVPELTESSETSDDNGFLKPGDQSMRRMPSTESMLYISMSRVESFDDSKWQHVRGQVNMRKRAIRESLPEINVRLPAIPKLPLNLRLENNATVNVNGHRPPTPPSKFTRSNSQSAIDRALETLEGDIVIMGGYRGSVLREAQAPHSQIWVPVKASLNLDTPDLAVPLSAEGEEKMEQKVIASGMLQNIGPVDISKKLFRKLRSSQACKSGRIRVWDYGYDWRLSPHILANKLAHFLAGLPCNAPGSQKRGATVIAHSLGGLITRHVVNTHPELFCGVLYAGVPQRCINILGALRHGDSVGLNDRILTARVNFSMRTSFLLLPEDGKCFFDGETGEDYDVDFFDPDSWSRYRLCPEMGAPIPTEEEKSSLSTFLSRRSFSSISPPASPISSPDRFRRAENHAYLKRVLPQVKAFRQELAFNPEHSDRNAYPPMAVLYSKNTPTIHRTQVPSRDTIATTSCYDHLTFHSGDGVVLAKEAMIPEGYSVVRDGMVESTRGHLTLLGDLEGVGQLLEALMIGRQKGIGLGVERKRRRESVMF